MRYLFVLLALFLCALKPVKHGDKLRPPVSSDRLISAQTPTFWIDGSATVQAEPILHYLMEDNAATTAVVDMSGNFAGISTRNTSVFTAASGKISRGLDFYVGSAADMVDLGADRIAATGDYTLAVWLNPDTINNFGRICGAATDGASTNLAHLNNVSGQIVYSSIVSPSNAITAGSWQHFTFVRKASFCSLYKDGALLQGPTSCDNSATCRYIGNRSALDRFYDGKMDDLRLYDRALSQSEVSAIYNNGSGHQNQSVSAIDIESVLDGSARVGSVQSAVTGYEALQTTDSNKPLLSTAASSRSCLSFDATDQLATTITDASIISGAAQTTFIVARFAVNGSVFYDSFGDWSIIKNATNFNYTNYDGVLDTAVVGGATANNLFILTAQHSGGNIVLCANGTCGTPVASGTTSTGGVVRLGDAASAMYICEVAVFNKALSSSVLRGIEEALARKWNIPRVGW